MNTAIKKPVIIAAAVVIAVGIICSLILAVGRIQAEATQKQAELVMDWTQLYQLSKREAVTIDEVLAEFAPYITGVIFKEPTVYQMQDEGRLLVIPGAEMLWQAKNGAPYDAARVNTNHIYLAVYDNESRERVLEHLTLKAPAAKTELFYESDGLHIISTSLPSAVLNTIGLGFSRRDLTLVDSYGLRVLVQIRDFVVGIDFSQLGLTDVDDSGVFASEQISVFAFAGDAALDALIRDCISANEAVIDALLRPLADVTVIAVGFNDKFLPGASLSAAEWSAVKQLWADKLNAAGYPTMLAEFFDQNGLQGLAQSMNQNIIRMHSISEAEMLIAAKVQEAPQRFQLAVSERKFRIAFVRTMNAGIDENIGFVDAIRTAIEAKGTTVGALTAPPDIHPSKLFLALIALAVCAGGYLLMLAFGFGRYALLLAALVFLGACGLLFIGKISMMQKLFALASVIIFPTLAVMRFLPLRTVGLASALGKVVLTTLFSLIGAALMVGLLADSAFMVKTDQFLGVKVAHLIPVLLVCCWFFFYKDKNKSPMLKVKDTLNMDLKVYVALIACFVAAAMMFYLMRTGNENAAVSDLERSIRAFLDRVLYVRPRTKEFLFGFPALLLIYRYGYRDLMLPVLVFAVIGQVSLVNTFAHIHTPVLISLLRTLNGFWLGIIIGLALLGVVVLVKCFYAKRMQGARS